MADGTSGTWYVSFEIPRNGRRSGKADPEQPQRFEMTLTLWNSREHDLQKDWSVSAGTFNPCLPKTNDSLAPDISMASRTRAFSSEVDTGSRVKKTRQIKNLERL
jgi:hypothetical protein